MWAGFSSHTTPIHRCIDALIHVCNDADMSRVISVVNTKGGVGKTTTAVYLATALSCQDRVVLLDADPQGSATSWATDAFETGDRLNFEVRPANAPIVRRCRDIDALLTLLLVTLRRLPQPSRLLMWLLSRLSRGTWIWIER